MIVASTVFRSIIVLSTIMSNEHSRILGALVLILPWVWVLQTGTGDLLLSLDCVLAKSPSPDRQWLTPLVSVEPRPSKYPGVV